MKYLLDTHILLWFLGNDIRLREEHKQMIEDAASRICLSVISLWEIALKEMKGKLRMPQNYLKLIKEQGIEIINLEEGHVEEYKKLPVLHADPFDRMLVAVAKHEKIKLVTGDTNIKKYNIELA